MLLQGGSLKKGTAIKDNADLDVVVFLNEFENMSDYISKLPHVLEELQKNIRDSVDIGGLVTKMYSTKYSLNISLSTEVGGDYLGVDVLPVPAFNNIKKPGNF